MKGATCCHVMHGRFVRPLTYSSRNHRNSANMHHDLTHSSLTHQSATEKGHTHLPHLSPCSLVSRREQSGMHPAWSRASQTGPSLDSQTLPIPSRCLRPFQTFVCRHRHPLLEFPVFRRSRHSTPKCCSPVVAGCGVDVDRRSPCSGKSQRSVHSNVHSNVRSRLHRNNHLRSPTSTESVAVHLRRQFVEKGHVSANSEGTLWTTALLLRTCRVPCRYRGRGRPLRSAIDRGIPAIRPVFYSRYACKETAVGKSSPLFSRSARKLVCSSLGPSCPHDAT